VGASREPRAGPIYAASAVKLHGAPQTYTLACDTAATGRTPLPSMMEWLACGSNGSGQLGLGHADDLALLTPLAFPARALWPGGRHTFFRELHMQYRSSRHFAIIMTLPLWT
jgi:hypothetical protein